MINADSIVLQSSPGLVIYARFQAESEREASKQTGLLIPEGMEHITAWPRHPVIEVRAGLFNEGDAQRSVIIVKVGASSARPGSITTSEGETLTSTYMTGSNRSTSRSSSSASRAEGVASVSAIR
jgi:hypothetical protein